MTTDPLAEAAGRYHQAVKRHKAAVVAAKRAVKRRAELAAEVEQTRLPMQDQIVAAGRARRRPSEIARVTGYTPERVRQILRGANVEPFEHPGEPQ